METIRRATSLINNTIERLKNKQEYGVKGNLLNEVFQLEEAVKLLNDFELELFKELYLATRAKEKKEGQND